MALSAQQHLDQYGISVESAYGWIMANLYQPLAIYNVCIEYGVTSPMLAEITGFSSAVVEGFFDSLGLDGGALRGDTTPGEGLAFVPTPFVSLAGLWTLNTVTDGPLSNEALREHVVDVIGQEYYDLAFDPAAYAGAADGVFSTVDLGFEHLGSLVADRATLESLFFGTAINLLRRVDVEEDAAIAEASEAEFTNAIVDAFADPVEAGQRSIAEESLPDECAFIAFMVPTALTGSLFEGFIDYWYPHD